MSKGEETVVFDQLGLHAAEEITSAQSEGL